MDGSDLNRYKSLFEGRSPFELAIKVKLARKFKSECRIVPIDGRCWILSVAVTVEYVPVQIQKKVELELRMRILGAAVCSGCSIHTFDCELGTLLHTIETSFQSINAVSLSNPPAFTKLVSL
jgi:hypothetical protein